MKGYDGLAAALKERLPSTSLEELGRATSFIQRMRTVSAASFVWATVLSRFAGGVPGFDQARQLFMRLTGRRIWQRPFQMRFKSAAAVGLFEKAFETSVAPWRHRRRVDHRLAKFFNDIVAIDSTVVQLNDKLGLWFKGQRGAVSEMKVALAASVFGLVPLAARLVSRNANDAPLLPSFLTLQRGTLLMFDNAFASYESLRKLTDAGLFFLCPMRRHAHAKIVAIHQAPKRVREALKQSPDGVSLRSLLDRNGYISKVWDLQVLVTPTTGEDRTPFSMRLVIVPHRKRPRYYITSIDPKWSAKAVAELYRLRWQIELLFKELKQHLALEAIPTKDPHAAQAFVWASLIALTISRTVAACLTPLSKLTGLAAPHCIATVSRSLRAALGEFVLLLSAAIPTPELRVLLPALAAASERRDRRRPDSFQRLAVLCP